MGKTKVVSISIPPHILGRLDALVGKHQLLGDTNVSRSAVIIELIQMAIPEYEERLNKKLARQLTEHEESMENKIMRKILFEW